MADDLADLVSRLDRIEELLSRRPVGPSAVPPGPEVRSARSIVSRIDDVWVAVTEGNERVVAAIEHARRVPAPSEGESGDAAAGPAPPPPEPPAHARTEAAVQQVAARLEQLEVMVGRLASRASDGLVAAQLDAIAGALAALGGRVPGIDAVPARLDAIERALSDMAARGPDESVPARLAAVEQQLAAAGGSGPEADTAVHLRLNRIEEALAGVAGRLAGPPGVGGADGAVLGVLERLEADFGRLGQRVEMMAQAVEASAAGNGDGTLAERLGRLRDQFRR